MSKNKIGWKEGVKIILRGYRTINGFEKHLLLSNILSGIFQAVYPFINLFLSAQIINELVGTKDKERLLLLVGITILTNLLCYLLKSGLLRWNERKKHLFWWNARYLTSHKLQEMDYIDTEDPEIRGKYDTIQMHLNGMGYGLNQLFWTMDAIIPALTQIVTSVFLAYGMFWLPTTVSGYLWLNQWWVNLLVVISIGIPVWFSGWCGKKSAMAFADAAHLLKDNNQLFRFYMNDILELSRQRDVRLYEQKPLDKNMNDSFGEVYLKTAKYRTVQTAVSFLFQSGIYLFAAVKALGGAFDIGSVVQYVGSVIQLTAGISGLIEQVNEWRANLPYLKNTFDFLDIPNRKYMGSLSVEQRDDNEYEIEFHDVSFRYPGSEQYALKHLNLKFKVGERMAVVGENGSGKSTMIKLLCRLYDPTEGKITLNGIDIQKYRYDQYMAIFGVVFQDFSLLPFTLGENVAAKREYDCARVKECLIMAGFAERLAVWEKGLDTYLYKNFTEEGVDISGGEAQKIALARALYKDAPFIVLDEPTAALDPVSEYEIYSKYNDMVEDKTAIYISHRLSSCRFCSDIAVFDRGELVQRGSHDELLTNREGKYYSLWNAQAQYYQNG